MRLSSRPVASAVTSPTSFRDLSPWQASLLQGGYDLRVRRSSVRRVADPICAWPHGCTRPFGAAESEDGDGASSSNGPSGGCRLPPAGCWWGDREYHTDQSGRPGEGPGRHGVPRRRGPRVGRLPGAAHGPTPLLRGRAGDGQDRAGAGALRGAGAADGAPAVPRGHRRRAGPVRLGLPAPAAAPAFPRGRGDRLAVAARRRRRRGLPLRPPLPARAPHPAGPAGRAVRAARRRGRPRRRRVRGLPARGARRELGHHPRDRRRPCRDAAAGGADVQPHARGARRPQAPLPLPLARAPRSGPRDRDPAPSPARPARGARRPGRPRGAGRCAGSTCSSRRASPSRSTGPRPCSSWARVTSTSPRPPRRWARC